MNIDFWHSFLVWNLVFNLGILILWITLLSWGRDWVKKFHSKWFPLNDENFALAHYLMFGLYKLSIFMLILIPLVALSILKA